MFDFEMVFIVWSLSPTNWGFELSSIDDGTEVIEQTDGPSFDKTGNNNATRWSIAMERALPWLTIATIIIFVLFIIIISQVLGIRYQFDADEDFENLDRNPVIISAVAIGDEETGVVYFESNRTDDYSDYRYLTPSNNDELFLMVLDEKGELLHDRIPVEGLDASYNETRNSTYFIFGTSSGVVFLYNGTPTEEGMSLLSYSIDTDTTERTESTNVVPGLNITDYEFNSVKSGDTVHVLLWRARNLNVPDDQPAAVYVRTTDGGQFWDEPVALLDNHSRVETAFPVVRGDVLALVLLGAKGYFSGGIEMANSVIRSTDGGASLKDPQRIFGTSPPSGKQSLNAGIGDNGTILIKAWTWGEGLPRTIYRIHPSGFSEEITVPMLHRNISVGLAPSETNPSQYRVDQFIGTYYDSKHYNIEIFNLDGEHIGTTLIDRDTAMDHGLDYPTRFVEGHLQGVEVARIGTSRGCIPRSSGEIRLVNQDPETWAKKMVGRPFEVVYIHSDDQKEAHMDIIDGLMTLAWNLWLLFSIAVVAITFTTKPSIQPSSSKTILSILVVGTAILLALLISATLYKIPDSYYITEFQAYAVFFAALGIFSVEVVARMGDRLRFTRLFHIPFCLFILLAAGDYAIWGKESGWYEDGLMILKYILWGPLVALVFLGINEVTKRGDILVPKHHMIWYWPVHTIFFIMTTIMPMFILRIMYD